MDSCRSRVGVTGLAGSAACRDDAPFARFH